MILGVIGAIAILLDSNEALAYVLGAFLVTIIFFLSRALTRVTLEIIHPPKFDKEKFDAFLKEHPVEGRLPFDDER